MTYYAVTYSTDMRERRAVIKKCSSVESAFAALDDRCGTIPGKSEGNCHRVIGSVYKADARKVQAEVKRRIKACRRDSIYSETRTGAVEMNAIAKVGERIER